MEGLPTHWVACNGPVSARCQPNDCRHQPRRPPEHVGVTPDPMFAMLLSPKQPPLRQCRPACPCGRAYPRNESANVAPPPPLSQYLCPSLPEPPPPPPGDPELLEAPELTEKIFDWPKTRRKICPITLGGRGGGVSCEAKLCSLRWNIAILCSGALSGKLSEPYFASRSTQDRPCAVALCTCDNCGGGGGGSGSQLTGPLIRSYKL